MSKAKTKGPLFDVLAVDMVSRTVRFLDTGKTERNAEAIEMMAVCRRGVEKEFFVTVPARSYREGDKWNGIPERSDR